MEDKLKRLKNIIKDYESVVVAFSGGVDSTFLAKVAGDVLKRHVLLVTVKSQMVPMREIEESKRLGKSLKLDHVILSLDISEIPKFVDNPSDRCYFCKSAIFKRIKDVATMKGYQFIIEGSNVDDLSDYRPGLRALKESGIKSPLCDAGLTKNDIRKFSSELGLATASKPSYACLASRIPYHETITAEKLKKVESAEDSIHDLGFHNFRVRSHGSLARIEMDLNEMDLAWKQRLRLSAACINAGFVYVALDLNGYKTGSMNKTI